MGGHRFGLSDGATRGCSWVGAASGGRVLRVSRAGAAVEATAAPPELVAREPGLAWDDDEQAAVNRPTSNIALSVARLIMVIGL
jgi:hypothetical protein